MITLITREIPKISFVSKKELSSLEIFTLEHKFCTEVDEFVLCRHGKEEIYINKELKAAEEIKEIVNSVMKEQYLEKIEESLNKLQEISGKKAMTALLYLWSDWRKEREKVRLKENADAILKQDRKKQLHRKARKNQDIIRTAFDIGFGLFEKGAKCDIEKGAECAFMIGYMMAQQDKVSL